MDPWLFPKEIRHYLGQTFNARSSGIVELRNHSIGGRSPKSIFTLWQLWINICIFFQKFFWLFEQCPVQPLWVLGMRCLHLPVRAFSKVLLLPVWVWLVLPSTAYSKGMLPLDLWRFRPGCQAHRVQAGGGSVHVWGAFHNSAKSPLVLPDGYLTGVLYGGILQNTLVPFARHYFGDNYRYQDDNATPHRARVVLDFLQQGNVTKMEQPPRSPDCNPIEHLWDELGRAISSMDNPPQNLDELRQALLDKWAQIPVQRLQRLVASMPRQLAAIIAGRGGNTRYWPGTHKTRPPGSVTKKIIFVRPNLPQLSSSDIKVCIFGQLLILSSNDVKTDKTQQNKK